MMARIFALASILTSRKDNGDDVIENMASRFCSRSGFFLAMTHRYWVKATPTVAVKAVFVRKAKPVPIRRVHCCWSDDCTTELSNDR